MRIEALEDFCHLGRPLRKGDVVQMSEADGQLACAHGWAKDTTGQYETGERKPGSAKPLVPEAIKHAQG